MRIEERKRLARDDRFNPERDLGKFDGKRVDVHAVDTVAYDVAQGTLVFGGAGIHTASSHKP